MQEVLGLAQSHLQKSMFQFSMNMDHREIMEEFMRTSVAPQTSTGTSDRDLTEEQVIEAVRQLNESQLSSIKKFQEQYANED